MEPLYRNILGKAWQITKKFKYLWLLGLFAAFLGNSAEYQVLIDQVNNVKNQASTLSLWQQKLNLLIPQLDFTNGKVLLIVFILLVSLAVTLLVLWLIISSLGGLIKGAAEADKGQKHKVGELLKTGSRKFWPVLGLNVIAKLIIYGVLVLIIGPLMLATFAVGNYTVNLLIILISFIIFVPLTVIISMIAKFGSIYAVLEGQKFREAFKNGWRMFAANWLIAVEMAVIIFLINLLAGLIFGVLAIVLLALISFLSLGMANASLSVGVFTAGLYVSLLLLLAGSLFIGAVLATFQTSAWTLLYLKLNSGVKVYSKLVRWIAAIFSKSKPVKLKE
ncbi:MAG TPA: hypothetical protein VJB39_00575 [Patescibacteria group bacterium]|nr:hypothetical protein [Patescibacteria group bacterium]